MLEAKFYQLLRSKAKMYKDKCELENDLKNRLYWKNPNRVNKQFLLRYVDWVRKDLNVTSVSDIDGDSDVNMWRRNRLEKLINEVEQGFNVQDADEQVVVEDEDEEDGIMDEEKEMEDDDEVQELDYCDYQLDGRKMVFSKPPVL